MYDIAVIGLGLIGSAAFRHLVEMGHRVVGIGPAEPKNLRDRDHIFASHYDQGRITRIIDPLPFWAMTGKRSIDAYADLEARSGIRFHEAVGCLRVSADPEAADDTLLQAEANGQAEGAAFRILSSSETFDHFPFLNVPAGARIVYEEGGAGYVNPRSLVSAQLICATNGGGSILRESVTLIEPTGDAVEITLQSGDKIRAGRALIAVGAWCNMLVEKPLALRPRPATTLLAAIDEDEAARLASMPSIIYRLRAHPDLYSIYALPPIRYPDGKIYVKIGGTFHQNHPFQDVAALDRWFHTAGDAAKGETVRNVLLDFLPSLRAESYHTMPCVVTYTEHGHPYIEQISPNVTIGVGGNGAAAKSSNEIGRIAALTTVHDEWVYDYERSTFSLAYA